MTTTTETPVAPVVDTTAGPAVPMTEEQKFIFDMKGWLLVPGVLKTHEIEACREHLRLAREKRDSLPPHLRHTSAGPVAELLDHPVAIGILREILGADASPQGYGFRCDGHYIQNRGYGDQGIEPHGGGPAVSPIFAYQCKNQRIYSGLTRVVWELNEVEHGKGGTLLMSGSHKANWSVPPAHLKKDSWLFETYACPPGSLLFFTENLCHSGAPWLNKNHNRLAVFNCYTAVDTQYHKLGWPHEVIEAMPPKRRSLFRGVWRANFSANPVAINDTYSPTNRAL